MTTEVVAPTTVTEPGVVADMPDDVYHRDPVPEGSLSHSGAKKLLPPSCPALFKWERDNGRPPKKTFDFGHAAHKLVLGVGAQLEVIPGDRWDTKDAKAAVAEARAAGRVPLKAAEMQAVQSMATALREHPIASKLLSPDSGRPEVSLFWRDTETGVMRRGRIDWLRDNAAGRLFVVDYKTSTTANPDEFGRTAANYGYHSQSDWYLDAVRAHALGDDPAFVFIVQAKEPPYLVSVVELDHTALQIGRERNRRAIQTYVECRTADFWPGYSSDIERVSLPRWAEYEAGAA